MKKSISVLLAVIMLCGVMIFPAYAAEPQKQEEVEGYRVVNSSVETFADGSTLTTTVYEALASTYAVNTKSGMKTTTFRDGDGVRKWDVNLYGTFQYTGSYATCTSSSMDYKVYEGNWKADPLTPSRSGNRAIGDFVMKRYKLGVKVETQRGSLYVACQADGTLY